MKLIRAWPVQQRPTSWKAWKLALDHLAPDNCVIPQLGDWFEHHHQQYEWYLDAEQIPPLKWHMGTALRHQQGSSSFLESFLGLCTPCASNTRG
jgi:hypothetical protein